jgi:shikimate 5-dehydrogenase
VVIEFGVGGPNVAVAFLRKTQAQVYIVESNRERFVEAADVLEAVSLYSHASGGDSRHFLNQQGTAFIAGVSAGLPRVSVTRHASYSENDASVLNTIIRVVEHGAYRPDTWLNRQ